MGHTVAAEIPEHSQVSTHCILENNSFQNIISFTWVPLSTVESKSFEHLMVTISTFVALPFVTYDI